MKIKNVFACLLFAYVPFPGLWSADNPDAAKPRIDLKREFKTRVETNQFGDVFIARLPMPDSSKLKNTDVVGPSMLALISYIDKDLDFEKLDESLNKATGAVDKKGDRKDSVPIDGLIAGANRYLASKNMGLQKVGFTANNFRQRIEDGVPILCWLVVSGLYDGEFTARASERSSAKSPDDWSKSLRKLEKKKIANSRGRLFSQALLLGFNKKTDEYLVAGCSKKPVWLTERELKNLMLNGYILRY